MYFLVSCQIWEAFRQIWAQKIYETWSFFQRLWFTYQKFWTKLFKEKWTLWPHLKFKYLNNNGIINTLSFKIFYAADPEFADFLSGKWTNWYEPNSNLFTSLGLEILTFGIVFLTGSNQLRGLDATSGKWYLINPGQALLEPELQKNWLKSVLIYLYKYDTSSQGMKFWMM